MCFILINAKTCKGSATDGIFRKHAFNSKLYRFFRALFHQCFVLNLFETADMTCMADVVFLTELAACQNDFCGIEHDDMIAAINMRSIVCFVLAVENGCT